MKSVLVTGATSGIGKAISKLLVDNDYFVFALGRNENSIKELETYSQNIKGIIADVTSQSDIDNAFNIVSNQTDKLYGIINNAGFVCAAPVEGLNIDSLRYQFEVNTFAPVMVAKKFLQLMTEGKIINTSSEASTGLFPFISPYCASKRALDILFNSLSNEFKKPDVKIVSVKPGIINTPLWQRSIDRHNIAKQNYDENITDKYKKEMILTEKYSLKCAELGMKPEKVAKLYLKILNAKNPKLSYLIGLDSFLSDFVYKLPISLPNAIIKWQIKEQTDKIN